MRILIFLFCFFSVVGFSQTDTLVFDTFHYPLKKTKVFYSDNQKIIPTLPSEYISKQNRKSALHYKCKSRNSYEFFDTEDGASIAVLKGLIDSLYRCEPDSMVFPNILDSIAINTKQLFAEQVYPYIKSQKNRYNFCSAKIYRLKNDSLVECDLNFMYSSLYIDFDFDNLRLPNPNGASYLITNLYYRKGKATYFLDKSIIVTIQ
jgi:hypothetical protein